LEFRNIQTSYIQNNSLLLNIIFYYVYITANKSTCKAGLDTLISANIQHKQWFGLDVQCSALVHNLNNINVQIDIHTGWTINQFPAFENLRRLANI
jgi:hypothetical protein